MTHPRADVTDGWQYSRYLDDPEDRWTAEMSPQLERLLTGSGLVAAGLGTPSTSSGPTRFNGHQHSRKGALQNTNLAWARRRRWVGSLQVDMLCAHHYLGSSDAPSSRRDAIAVYAVGWKFI